MARKMSQWAFEEKIALRAKVGEGVDFDDYIQTHHLQIKSWYDSGMTIQDAVTNIRRELEKGNSR